MIGYLNLIKVFKIRNNLINLRRLNLLPLKFNIYSRSYG